MNKKNHGFTSKSRRSYRLYREHTSLIKIELIMITHLMCNIFYVELNENKFFKASTSIFLKKLWVEGKNRKSFLNSMPPQNILFTGGKKFPLLNMKTKKQPIWPWMHALPIDQLQRYKFWRDNLLSSWKV